MRRKAALLAGVCGGAALAGTWGFRMATQTPEVVEVVVAPAPSKVRTRFVKGPCPPPSTDHQAWIAELEHETRRLRLDAATYQNKVSKIGTSLPADQVAALAPSAVRPELEALLPDVGEVTWVCERFPCSGVVQFDPEHEAEAMAFVDAVNARFSGATHDPTGLDSEGWSTREAPDSLAVYIQVMPTDLDEDQERRAYYHRRLTTERLLSAVREPAEPSTVSQ